MLGFEIFYFMHNINFIGMAYVKQVCDGYTKKSLMGNWFEERQYPNQPFRQEQKKNARNKDEGITCFDQTGFQRLLPRLQRRSKWETAGRIILDDGYKFPNSTNKAAFYYQQLATSAKPIKQPFSKNLSQIHSTQLHPYSQMRVNKMQSKMLNHSTIEQLKKDRELNTEKTFRPLLPKTKVEQKAGYYHSHYNLSYVNPEDLRNLNKSCLEGYAGSYNQNPEETVKHTTTLVGQFKKQEADVKQQTKIQRSWIPPKDRSLIFGARETLKQIKKSSIPQNDIQTSLNMNIGIHNIHPKNVENNYFGHKISEITRNTNKSPCRR